MRILLLTPRVPWPPVDGGRIAMARLAESLVRAGAEVEVLSLNPRKDPVERIDAPLPIRAIDVDTAPRLSLLWRAAPWLVARFESRAFRAALRETLARFRPDVVQIESPFLLPYAEEVRDARVVLRSLNVEFRIWERLAARERNPLRRFALRRVAASMRRYELAHGGIPIVAISREDADDYRALGCTGPIHVAPCGISLERRPSRAAEDATVGFIGSLNFRPNQDAVRWIVDELWPRVIARVPEARLSIAGSSAPGWLRPRGEHVAFLGRVDDAAAFLESMAVVIAPLFAGGGMRIKVLEAMALGRPVVATQLGAGGVDVEAGRDILLAEDADAFADAVVRLLRDRALAARIGAAARATVEAKYDDDRIARGVLAFYASL